MIAILTVAIALFTSPAKAACSGASPSWTATIDQPSVLDCVIKAAQGDTINVLAGTADWSSGNVRWSDKDLTIVGAGQGRSILQMSAFNPLFQYTVHSGGMHSIRITGFTIQGLAPSGFQQAIQMNSGVDQPVTGVRFDHITFDCQSAGCGTDFTFNGIVWGVTDHIILTGTGHPGLITYGFVSSDFDASGNPCNPHCPGFMYWNQGLNLGTDKAMYMEDWDGSGITTWTGNSTANDEEDGGAIVIRHSKFRCYFFQTHSTRGPSLGGAKLEVYNNTFDGCDPTFTGAGPGRVSLQRSGTGVYFNNTITNFTSQTFQIDGQREDTTCQCTGQSNSCGNVPLGACNGSNPADGNLESTGWPCLGEVGRGAVANWNQSAITLTSSPIYQWNNGPQSTCAAGGACDGSVSIVVNGACTAPNHNISDYLKTVGNPHAGGAVDYVNGPPSAGYYTPFTYPHPLTLSGPVALAPGKPTGLVMK